MDYTEISKLTTIITTIIAAKKGDIKNNRKISLILDIGIVFSFLCITQSKSDWLLNAQSRLLQADWLTLENNEKATIVTCSTSTYNFVTMRDIEAMI